MTERTGVPRGLLRHVPLCVRRLARRELRVVAAILGLLGLASVLGLWMGVSITASTSEGIEIIGGRSAMIMNAIYLAVVAVAFGVLSWIGHRHLDGAGHE